MFALGLSFVLFLTFLKAVKQGHSVMLHVVLTSVEYILFWIFLLLWTLLTLVFISRMAKGTFADYSAPFLVVVWTSVSYIPTISVPVLPRQLIEFFLLLFLVGLFAMTINKIQGKRRLRLVCFYNDTLFFHTESYIAMSRVKNKQGLRLPFVGSKEVLHRL